MSTVTLTVPNISCGHCVSTIQRELKMVPGVADVKADAQTKQVVLQVQDDATLTEARKTLVEIGYPAA